MLSTAARHEQVQKRLQCLKDQREQEERCFDELAALYPNLSVDDLSTYASAQAREKLEKQIIVVGGEEVRAGQTVEVLGDRATLYRVEQGILLPDAVKQVYLGERAKVLRVFPSFHGKAAVDLRFADGAEKVFMAECLNIGYQRRGLTKVAPVVVVATSSDDEEEEGYKGGATKKEDVKGGRAEDSPEWTAPPPTWDLLRQGSTEKKTTSTSSGPAVPPPPPSLSSLRRPGPSPAAAAVPPPPPSMATAARRRPSAASEASTKASSSSPMTASNGTGIIAANGKEGLAATTATQHGNAAKVSPPLTRESSSRSSSEDRDASNKVDESGSDRGFQRSSCDMLKEQHNPCEEPLKDVDVVPHEELHSWQASQTSVGEVEEARLVEEEPPHAPSIPPVAESDRSLDGTCSSDVEPHSETRAEEEEEPTLAKSQVMGSTRSCISVEDEAEALDSGSPHPGPTPTSAPASSYSPWGSDGLGRPLDLTGITGSSPSGPGLAMGMEMENLVKTPRPDFLSWTARHPHAAPSLIPINCPDTYAALYDLNDDTTRIAAARSPCLGESIAEKTFWTAVYDHHRQNGEPLFYQPLQLDEADLLSMEHLLSTVTRMLEWPNGSAERLFTADGVEIMWPNELREDVQMVATSGGRFHPDLLRPRKSASPAVSRLGNGSRTSMPSRRGLASSASTETTTTTTNSASMARREASAIPRRSPPQPTTMAPKPAGVRAPTGTRRRAAATTAAVAPAPAAPAPKPRKLPAPTTSLTKPIHIRVYENGIYDEDDRSLAHTMVTVRPTFKTLAAVKALIGRELHWRDGKRVDMLFDAAGSEIEAPGQLTDGASVVASAGDRFIVPYPNTALHRAAMKL